MYLLLTWIIAINSTSDEKFSVKVLEDKRICVTFIILEVKLFFLIIVSR